MRLTQYTDYSLRVLLYLAQKKDGLATITEIADFYQISRNHLVKVVHNLGMSGHVQTLRGKKGGMRLGRAPESIVIGDVVRTTEPDFDLLECFNPSEDQCVFSHTCSLKPALFSARKAFLDTLDKYTLADAIKRPVKSSPAFKSIPIVHE
jgi:Rrf2 family nitric oxide-sensitive transcriptional repressor